VLINQKRCKSLQSFAMVYKAKLSEEMQRFAMMYNSSCSKALQSFVKEWLYLQSFAVLSIEKLYSALQKLDHSQQRFAVHCTANNAKLYKEI